MEIYFCTYDRRMADVLAKEFHGYNDVDVFCGQFEDFMATHDVDCVVSPANAYGYMDGSYDAAITSVFGRELMDAVQQYIVDNYYGEQPIGTSFIIDIPNSGKKLIHTPSMRVPSTIHDPHIVYQCMRTTLMCAIENNVQSIVIPPFGNGVGKVPCESAATLLRRAYDQIKNQTTLIGMY